MKTTDIETWNINDIVGEAADLFRRSHPDVLIHRKYQKGVWPVELKADLVTGIVLTLLNNAGQAMPDGGHLYAETVNLIVKERRAGSFYPKPGRYVKVSITDTGSARRIFFPFAAHCGKEGDGAGSSSLDVIYGIVRRYGGIITLNRKEDIGITFSVYLPASDNAIGLAITTLRNPLVKNGF